MSIKNKIKDNDFFFIGSPIVNISLFVLVIRKIRTTCVITFEWEEESWYVIIVCISYGVLQDQDMRKIKYKQHIIWFWTEHGEVESRNLDLEITWWVWDKFLEIWNLVTYVTKMTLQTIHPAPPTNPFTAFSEWNIQTSIMISLYSNHHLRFISYSLECTRLD